MNLRRDILFLSGMILLLAGCAHRPSSAATGTETVARVHWLGLNQISTDTNASQFMSVWQLPQTAALLAQTLDKLSRWPVGGVTNTASALIRPLLDDLVSSETYLEVCAPTNFSLSAGGEGRGEMALNNSQLFIAVRLSADRARLWQTNLAAFSNAMTGRNNSTQIQCSKTGEWTLVGLGQGSRALKSEFAASLPQGKSAGTNWLEADLNPSRLVSSLSAGGEGRDEVANLFAISHQLSAINLLHLTINAESNNLFTRATLNFSRPLNLKLSPWEIPTNLIHSPLTSFTAVRGLAPWLATLPVWQKLQLNPDPDQGYFWSQVQTGGPFVTYFAAPLSAASNQLSQLAARLVQNANPWLATNGEGDFQWQNKLPGLVWNGAALLSPFLKPVLVNQQDFALGGLVPFIKGNPNPMPAEFPSTVLATSNLVYYHTEQTGSRVEDGLFIIQLFRMMFHKPQLPAKAIGTLWLKNVEPLLEDSATSVTQTGPQQLVLTRTSTIGFTALELHLLTDWLESPQFPHGLHTFTAPPDQ